MWIYLKFIYTLLRTNQTIQQKIILNILYYIYSYLNNLRKERNEKMKTCNIIIVEKEENEWLLITS